MTTNTDHATRAREVFLADLDGMLRACLDRAARDYLQRSGLVSRAAAKRAAWEFSDVWMDELKYQFIAEADVALGEFMHSEEGLALPLLDASEEVPAA